MKYPESVVGFRLPPDLVLYRICYFVFAIALLSAFIIPLAACRTTGDVLAEQPPADLAETIENKGSDTLVNLALAWAEAYMQIHPEVRISVTGGGSGTGIAAMINGTVDIANASRAMKPEEIQAARANGFDPIEYTVARDAIAVVVH
ncbi:MAG: substrate-binding domain-containing protein, partial [Chloroflexi bacterium]|nr:substrate-binding domain-containing protein [Chloroflexota bacterium]